MFVKVRHFFAAVFRIIDRVIKFFAVKTCFCLCFNCFIYNFSRFSCPGVVKLTFFFNLGLFLTAALPHLI